MWRSFSDVGQVRRCALDECEARPGWDGGWVADEGCYSVVLALLEDVGDDLRACLAASACDKENA